MSRVAPSAISSYAVRCQGRLTVLIYGTWPLSGWRQPPVLVTLPPSLLFATAIQFVRDQRRLGSDERCGPLGGLEAVPAGRCARNDPVDVLREDVPLLDQLLRGLLDPPEVVFLRSVALLHRRPGIAVRLLLLPRPWKGHRRSLYGHKAPAS